MSNLKQRLSISFIGVAILLFSISLAANPLFRPLFVLLVAAVIVLSLREYFHIVHSKGWSPERSTALVGSIAFILSDYFAIAYPSLALLPAIALFATTIALFLFYFINGEDPLCNISLTIFGIAYLAIPLSLALNITYYFPEESGQDGRYWLLYLLLITKITDTGAYVVGKKFGATKMAPYISPQKTWEGAVGGLTAALLASVLFFLLLNRGESPAPMVLTYWQSIWVAGAISLLAQFGDLAESLIKRDVGVKDSSHLPGLGGFLDIVDSVIFTCPFIYFFLKLNY